jgi:LPLT family lysophospholipid transporter-like MFS transporter
MSRRAMRAVIGAQFFSALADNALLIVAIGLLQERAAPAWMTPALRICLYAAYVLLAPFAGALADAFPKGLVMLASNLVKLFACLLMAAGAHPLLAFGAIGVVGVTYGPAKYGILAELVAPARLVSANAWIEMSTVAAILGGAVLGALLLTPAHVIAGIDGPAHSACVALLGVYAVAALFAAAIPAARVKARGEPAGFRRELALLWRDPHGRISLAVTALFWAVAAALQFLVIQWAGEVLGLTLSQAALMQCLLAAGMVAGAAGAGRFVAAPRAMAVLPGGLLLGAAMLAMALVGSLWLACAMLLATGVVAGIVLVPMNALLQQRGNALMAPGGSIAVQAFNENLAALVLLAVYCALLVLAVPARAIVAGFGALVVALVLAIMRWRRAGGVALAGQRP